MSQVPDLMFLPLYHIASLDCAWSLLFYFSLSSLSFLTCPFSYPKHRLRWVLGTPLFEAHWSWVHVISCPQFSALFNPLLKARTLPTYSNLVFVPPVSSQTGLSIMEKFIFLPGQLYRSSPIYSMATLPLFFQRASIEGWLKSWALESECQGSDLTLIAS